MSKICPRCSERNIPDFQSSCPRCFSNLNDNAPVFPKQDDEPDFPERRSSNKLIPVVMAVFAVVIVLAVVVGLVAKSSSSKASKSSSAKSKSSSVASADKDSKSDSSKKEDAEATAENNSEDNSESQETDDTSIFDKPATFIWPADLDYEAKIASLKKSGTRSSLHDSEVDSLAIEAANYLCVTEKQETLELSEEGKRGLKLEDGSCIIDDERDVYQDDEYLVICTPCFGGNSKGWITQYSGRIEVLMAKYQGADFNYVPLYIKLIKNGKQITDADVTSKMSEAGGSKLYDGNVRPWKEGASGTGEGEGFTLTVSGGSQVSGILLINGDCSSESDFNRNGKIKKIQVDFGNGVVTTQTLDTTSFQRIQNVSAGQLVNINKIRVTILEGESGNATSDVAVTEVQVY